MLKICSIFYYCFYLVPAVFILCCFENTLSPSTATTHSQVNNTLQLPETANAQQIVLIIYSCQEGVTDENLSLTRKSTDQFIIYALSKILVSSFNCLWIHLFFLIQKMTILELAFNSCENNLLGFFFYLTHLQDIASFCKEGNRKATWSTKI